MKQIVPGRVIALYSCRDIFTGREYAPKRPARKAFIYEMGWVFVLDETGYGTARLLIRTRLRGNMWFHLLRPAVAILGMGDTVTQRTMLQGIGGRAERMRGDQLTERRDVGTLATAARGWR